MKIEILSSPEEIGIKLARKLYRRIMLQPKLVVGLATGSTPLPFYSALVSLVSKKPLDLSRITTFNLDEYYPIGRSNCNSYYFFMNKYLFKLLKLNDTQVNLLSGEAKDYHTECKNYEGRIKVVGGIDWQLLGIGVNGHIGFNEPGSEFNSLTRRVRLSGSTIEMNRRFFSNDKIPFYALTMGLKTILSAKDIHLIATGENKSRIVRKLILTKPSKKLPASILKLHHNVTIWLDNASAKLLEVN